MKHQELVLIFSFLLLNNVNSEDGFDPVQRLGKGKENSMMMVLEFPFEDEKSKNTFATAPISFDVRSFTLCFAFLIKAFEPNISDNEEGIQLFYINDESGQTVCEATMKVEVELEYEFAVLDFRFSSSYLRFDFPTLPLPSTWIRSCLSLDNGNLTASVDGHVLKSEQPENRKTTVLVSTMKQNFTLGLGKGLIGAITEVNLFSPSPSHDSSPKSMKSRTEQGGQGCGASGNLFNWTNVRQGRVKENSTFSLHGKSKIKTMLKSKGPCQKKSKVNVFNVKFNSFFDCMEHCQKLGTRSPPVRTLEELRDLKREIATVTPLTSYFELWLSVTQGEVNSNNQLESFEHWPQDTKVMVGIWRDYYTGKSLDKFYIYIAY